MGFGHSAAAMSGQRVSTDREVVASPNSHFKESEEQPYPRDGSSAESNRSAAIVVRTEKIVYFGILPTNADCFSDGGSNCIGSHEFGHANGYWQADGQCTSGLRQGQ